MHDYLDNSERTIIITGSSAGIGNHMVKFFLEKNYKIVSCARSEQPNDLKDANHIYVQGDATMYSLHDEMVKKCTNIFSAPSSYINNVGMSEWRPISEISEDFLNTMLDVNLKSSFWGCKAALNSSNLKSILNISSLAGKRGSANNSVYCAAKFGINGLTQSLAKELGPNGIRVNALCPVLIETPGLLKALKSPKSPAKDSGPDIFLENFESSNVALSSLPTAEELCDVVQYFISENSSAITGQCVNVDCGVFPQ